MDETKQVRDFLEPVVQCAGQDTVDQVLATLSRGHPVVVTQEGRWHLLLPEAGIGCPTSRRVIDLPLRQVPRVSPDLPALEALTRLAERRAPYGLVVDGDRLLGIVSEKRLVEYRDLCVRERTEAALAERTRQLEAIHAVTTEISRELDLTTLLQLITRRAAELVHVASGTVWLWDGEAQVLVPKAWHGHSEEWGQITLRSGEGVAGTVARRREGLIVNDYRTSPIAHPFFLERTDVTAVMGEPLMYRERLLGVLTIDDMGIGRPFTEKDLELIALFASQAAIAIENARLFQSVSEQHAHLRTLLARLAGAEEDQRKRLSRELHDCVGGNLTTLSLNLMIAQNHFPNPGAEAAAARIEECSRLVEEAAQQIRTVMTELRPPLLDDHGLLAALRWHADQVSSRTAVSCAVRGEEPIPRLPREVELALFRVAQEALTNAAKHARARHLTIALEPLPDRVRLIVSDDGIGFDPSGVRRPGGQGWGLLTMRERAEAIGGAFRMESTPGTGTRVVVEVPR